MPNNRNPRVEILEETEDSIRFELSNTDTSMANALRRIMIAEVPTLCVDLVNFHENTTSLQDEFIAHRLGLIPLRSTTDLRHFNFKHQCECLGGCPNCSVTFELDVEFDERVKDRPDHEKQLPITITSKDLRCVDHHVSPAHFSSEDEAQRAQDEGIAIMKIGPGQALKLTAVAYKGIAKEHAKWSPVSVATYKFDPIIRFDQERLNDMLTLEQKREFVESCPTFHSERPVYTLSDAGQVSLTNPTECIFCRECVYYLEDLPQFKKDPDSLPLSIKHGDDKFTFTVETTGALTPRQVCLSAIAELQQKLRNAKMLLVNLTSSRTDM